ncbi:hypothetical protein K438DRAFT_1844041 [Mycena galopus ATCC 62051]|nr:hypothetical protein K438DRAFT_1844041 [Mycena galopus ATCC 62051]
MGEVFTFTHLPTELALEIIRVASLPDYENATATRPSYATAVSLASVSHAMRSATMPHLLHSVVLASSPQVFAFVDSILLQKHFVTYAPQLALDYPKLVRRFWSTECWEALMEDSHEYCIDYAALYSVIRGVDSLGLNFHSLHLLYNGLASPGADPMRDWKCHRVTFAGSCLPRWRPLTSSTEGIIFLSRISHLTLWISADHLLPPMHETRLVPRWVPDVPFVSFRSLTHFAFPLCSHSPNRSVLHVPTGTLVYIAPSSSADVNANTDFEPCEFRQWALDKDPLGHGVLVPFRHPVPPTSGLGDELGWEFLFMAGECEAAWAQVDRMRIQEGGCDMDWE